MTGERVRIGIEGLDEMIGGGLIKGSITAVIGTYGTGKTQFGLNFVWEGLNNGEKAIYISLEEPPERLYAYMAAKNWDFTPFKNSQLIILRLDPTDFNMAINHVKKELPALITQFKASRVVIDPISLFEDLFDSSAERRQEIMRFIEDLRDQGCTVILTSETARDNVYSSRYNLIEYLCDTVILLRYIRSSDHTDVHLALEVVKMRLSAHSREIKPYEIQAERILVYTEANVF